MKKLFTYISVYIHTASINALTTWPVVIGFLFMIASLALLQRLYGEHVPDISFAMVGFVSALISGLSGLFQVIRREGPGVFGGTVKGMYPVVLGLVWLLAMLAMGLFFLYDALF